MPLTKTRRKVRPAADAPPAIEVRGARTHNLKGVSCAIPAGSLTVVTGVSGSGKSSLAFDTLFAEGQRRYVESLSTYARQFIARMPRPDVEEIVHIPPAIALEQKNPVRNARSTIGTATEINDYLRLLFAKAGRMVCPLTGEEVRQDSPATAAREVLSRFPDARLYIMAPVRLAKKSMAAAAAKELLRQGYTRLLFHGEIVEMDVPDFKLPTGQDELMVVTDRLVGRRGSRGRLTEAVENAYRLGRGRCLVRTAEGGERLFTEEWRCPSCPGDCGQTFRPPTLQLLNFSSPAGACPGCQGFGRTTGLDWGKILPDPGRTLRGGAVAPWTGEAGRECLRDLEALSATLAVRMDVPWRDLTKREQQIVIDGKGEWYGIRGFFDWLNSRRYKVQARIQIARFRGYGECEECGGTRLRPEALAVQVGGRSIARLCDMTVKDLSGWFRKLRLSAAEAKVAERPLEEIRSRLDYLLEVGLGYLTLSRQTRTLSGGESQRINLSTALGSALTETLYVLDEPTVGLHPRDTERLIGVLRKLTRLGNTVVVVEHDLDIIRAADNLIDIGPGAGEKGGEIVYQGRAEGLSGKPGLSRTAPYLAGKGERTTRAGKAADAPRRNRHGRRKPSGWVSVRGASEHNLKHLDVRFPLGVLCGVTGVSGSGKSTLVRDCLYENYRRGVLGDPKAEPGSILGLDGLEHIDGMVLVDQSPIGRSTRSNAATYLKAYDWIRALMAMAPESMQLGLSPRDFSFNVTGGRCEACQGSGFQTIDMHFLADVQVICEACEGRRFQDRVLKAHLRGKTIIDILDMTVTEACGFFAEERRVLDGLRPLERVGLGYLRLGQSTATLSGGEAQRLKLAGHLAEAERRGNQLLLFDEPTTGLHPADLDVLLSVFDELLQRGYSIIVIEHNLQLLRRADYIIDLGPEGGVEGGTIVVEGTPESVAAASQSLTGRFLRTGGDIPVEVTNA